MIRLVTESGALSGKVVLLVDDDLALLDILSRFLERRGYTVHTAITPIGAGTMVAEESPDIIVLDLLMPALGGGSIAQLLRSRGDAIPIVFYTSMPVEEAASLTAGIADGSVVSKNDGPKALLQELERALLEHG
jgi:CheY-like chemotaxis protein